jgi:hypothetical protein
MIGLAINPFITLAANSAKVSVVDFTPYMISYIFSLLIHVKFNDENIMIDDSRNIKNMFKLYRYAKVKINLMVRSNY